MHSTPVNITPPPRPVPLSLRIVNMFGAFSQIGWFVFGFGMIFFWVFVGNADLSFITFRGAHEQATGRVTGVENTNASVNEQNVQANHYEFSVAGQPYRGTSYTTGAAASQGEEVTVEYDPDNPERSRIAGMRRSMFGPGILFVTIFPLVGLLFVIFSTRGGFRRNRLLREGLLAQGTLIHKTRTNVTINDRPLWELTFEFTDRLGQRREAKARSTDTDRLEDEATEVLLYDPNEPSAAYVLDEVPARPQFEMNGELKGHGAAAFARLIIPGIVIAANVMVLLAKLK